MKVGIYGGTFDPIHHGHLITAQAVKEIRGLDKIIFMPSYIAPHKLNKDSAPPLHRMIMLNYAIKGIPYFESSDWELNKLDVSYTIDTLKYMKEKYDHLELIIGYDNLLDFSSWKMPDEILKYARLVVLKRTWNEREEKDKYFYLAEIINTPLIEISATDIRKRVNNNLPIDFLVPEKVKEYIYALNLYKDVNS